MRCRAALSWCAVLAVTPSVLGVPSAHASAAGPAAREESVAREQSVVEVSVPCTPDRTRALNTAIEDANRHPGMRWDISLHPGCTYEVTDPYGGLNGLTAVVGNVRLSSRGPSPATVARSSAAGAARFRVPEVETDGRLALDRITVRGGAAIGTGGGVFNNYGTITLHHSAVVGNDAGDVGGRIATNGQNTTDHGARQRRTGRLRPVRRGGLFNNGGTVRLHHSRVTSNDVTAGSGGGVLNNGRRSRLTLEDSAVTGNRARRMAGGILNSGSVPSRDAVIARNSPNDCAGSARLVPGCDT